jgi:hypothetical protein
MLEDEPLMRHRLDGLQDAANKPPLFGVAFGLALLSRLDAASRHKPHTLQASRQGRVGHRGRQGEAAQMWDGVAAALQEAGHLG